MDQDLIEILAEFIDKETPQQSIALEMPDSVQQLKTRAKRFFNLRAALGIHGWTTGEDTRAAIKSAIGKHIASKL